MTLRDIEEGLPNGLHDAELQSFAVDLASGTLTLEVEVDRSSPEQGTPDPDFCEAKIVVTGLCYFKLEPPDVLHQYALGHSRIDAGDDPVQKGVLNAEIASKLPENSFLHWIYLDRWNAIMVIGGMDARIDLDQSTVL